MLLSILKILFFFAVILAVALGLMQLSESGQVLFLSYGGQEFALGPIKVVVLLAVLLLVAWVVFKLLGLLVAVLRFVAGDDTAIRRHFARSRQRKGYDALADGLLAIAAGEGKLAQDKAARARKYLDRPHVASLLTAQAAEVAGDTARAEAAYRAMLADDRTRFIGVRGLMQQQLAKGNTATALELAKRAYALKPRQAEIQNTLLDLQAKAHDWKGARATLKDKRKQGELPQDVHIRRDAVLALQEATEVLRHENSVSAREAAISAAKASPDLVPAAVLAARSYTAQNDARNAARVLEKTWSVNPHPDLAAAYAELVPDETPQARVRRFERLIAKNPNAEESRLLRAELLLTAEDFPAARRALGDLAQSHPTVRSLSLMAAIERGEGADDVVVRGWLARALTASRGPQWCCERCQNVMPEWAPVCDSCGGFDTLVWREPEDAQAGGLRGPGAEMLPLLIGPTAPARPEGGAAARDAEGVEDAEEAPDPAPAPARPGPAQPEPAVAEPAVGRDGGTGAAAPAGRSGAPAADLPEPSTTVTEPDDAPTDSGAGDRADVGAAHSDAESGGTASYPRQPLPEPERVRPPEREPELVRPDVLPPEDADWIDEKPRR